MTEGIAGASTQASEARGHLGRLVHQSTTTHTDVIRHHAASPFHQATTTERLDTASLLFTTRTICRCQYFSGTFLKLISVVGHICHWTLLYRLVRVSQTHY